MGWQGHLDLHYRHDGTRTTALDRHHGPLRVLQRLYPEGDAVCHHVLVHPPGGIVGGDELVVNARLEPGSHALITTPGATRFYRSNGPLAVQQVQAQVAEGARLEWLPLEAIAYPGCRVENRLRFTLAPGAQMMGLDVLALGLPAAGEAFGRGSVTQQIELPGVWLERGRLDGDDTLLLQSPLGLAGRSVLGTLWLADGQALPRSARETLLDAARALIDGHALAATAGVTAPDESLLVLRVLGERVEPVIALLHAVWAAWRQQHWQLAPCTPRVWRT
ncbi:urease accessory protein UreD [Ideonella sp. DXS22W]|uniref:Urease accessory protein UreD n=1 Tax=Pseudaquabacterium inlustre TaxID=2984192 RepID=A0ABU9CJ40_9BURK